MTRMMSECGSRPLLIMSCKISIIITSFTCMHFTKLICNWFQVNFQFSHISDADSIKSVLPLYCIWTVPHVHNEPNAFNVWFAVCTQIALQSWNEVCKYHYTVIVKLDSDIFCSIYYLMGYVYFWELQFFFLPWAPMLFEVGFQSQGGSLAWPLPPLHTMTI